MGHRLVPESAMKKYGRPPRRLPRSPGHDKEWIDACRGGAPAGSDFVRHSGLLTEAILLPNVALRAGKKLHWDGANFASPTTTTPTASSIANTARDGRFTPSRRTRPLLTGPGGGGQWTRTCDRVPAPQGDRPCRPKTHPDWPY